MRLNAIIAGVGMTHFGKHLETGLKALGAEAVEAAVGDAGIALDDLQDITEDLEAGHETLFTVAAQRGTLDPLVARLYHFIDRCLAQGKTFSARCYRDRKDLIRRNCRSLLVTAVAEQPHLFSRRCNRSFEDGWPLGFASVRRLRRFAERRFSAVGDDLRAQRGADTLIELLCPEDCRTANASMSRP